MASRTEGVADNRALEVEANIGGVDDAVAAGLEEAGGVAAIAVGPVAVVAGLALIHRAVAAAGGDGGVGTGVGTRTRAVRGGVGAGALGILDRGITLGVGLFDLPDRVLAAGRKDKKRGRQQKPRAERLHDDFLSAEKNNDSFSTFLTQRCAACQKSKGQKCRLSGE